MNNYNTKKSSYHDEGSDYFNSGRSDKSLEAELIGISLAILIPIGIVSTLYWLFKAFC